MNGCRNSRGMINKKKHKVKIKSVRKKEGEIIVWLLGRTNVFGVCDVSINKIDEFAGARLDEEKCSRDDSIFFFCSVPFSAFGKVNSPHHLSLFQVAGLSCSCHVLSAGLLHHVCPNPTHTFHFTYTDPRLFFFFFEGPRMHGART